MDYKIGDLTKEEAAYIGEKINEIVPREVDAEVEEFVLKVENENGEIIGGCIAEAYEYHCFNESERFCEEPYAGKPHVRICEGRVSKGICLLDCEDNAK